MCWLGNSGFCSDHGAGVVGYLRLLGLGVIRCLKSGLSRKSVWPAKAIFWGGPNVERIVYLDMDDLPNWELLKIIRDAQSRRQVPSGRDLATLLKTCGTAPGTGGLATRRSTANCPDSTRSSWDSTRKLLPVKPALTAKNSNYTGELSPLCSHSRASRDITTSAPYGTGLISFYILFGRNAVWVAVRMHLSNSNRPLGGGAYFIWRRPATSPTSKGSSSHYFRSRCYTGRERQMRR